MTTLKFLLKCFSLGWAVSIAGALLYIALASFRAHRRAPDEVAAISISIGSFLLWTIVGAFVVTIMALIVRAWLSPQPN